MNNKRQPFLIGNYVVRNSINKEQSHVDGAALSGILHDTDPTMHGYIQLYTTEIMNRLNDVQSFDDLEWKEIEEW